MVEPVVAIQVTEHTDRPIPVNIVGVHLAVRTAILLIIGNRGGYGMTLGYLSYA